MAQKLTLKEFRHGHSGAPIGIETMADVVRAYLQVNFDTLELHHTAWAFIEASKNFQNELDKVRINLG